MVSAPQPPDPMQTAEEQASWYGKRRACFRPRRASKGRARLCVVIAY
jgi:hypothetical protein